MRFEKHIPCQALQPYIKYFVISEITEADEYKVLPGTSVVIGFQYRGSLQKTKGAGEGRLASAGITGLQDSYQVFKNSADIGTVLVFFTETGASHFFKIPLNEIFTQSLSLDIFIPRSIIEIIEEQMSEAKTDNRRIHIIETFLLSQLQQRETDNLVSHAIDLIINSNGTLRIGELSQRLYISQSPLEKRFRKIVGATPKKYSSIIRINSVINNPVADKSLTELGYASGYFDQSHFIKDFKTFTGQTPEQFFSSKNQ
ncbi:AraC family transcriptional regulator [Flavobacterium sp. NRK1]|uniref:helix-turn-helix domain-containing protein n=1 Tax=Flavobacterium sp. NRK1 TaxID=2954929 RepID=UPI002093197A|nr:AraC family transcriptional regulator [Flavobacterium sp. NRK1]MCO6146855.1 AraC family transcriptional regulator [Flavobacterium sp. NRK1]